MKGASLPVHVVTTQRRYKDRVYKTHLLRRSYREDGKVKNETVGNLSSLPEHVVELIRRALKGETLAATTDLFEIVSSSHHGAVQAVKAAMDRLGVASLLAARSSEERQVVLAMVASRILEPQSKLATTRWWHTTTIPEEFGVAGAEENDLYTAMDWLLARQDRIEKKLAARHLDEDSLVLYDLSSSYFEGKTCPLAKLGYSRDGKRDRLQVNYGLVTNGDGCPVAVSVHPGNTGDPKTLLPQVQRMREVFGIDRLVLVGDRGMISQRQINTLKEDEQIDWITALRSESLRKLRESGCLQMGLFDERNLFELSSPDFPDERLIACHNAELAKLRAKKRESLIQATVRELKRIQGMVERGRLEDRADIGVRVGRIINKYKVSKHFFVRIRDKSLSFRVRKERVAAEAALDGVYVIRTSLSDDRLSKEDAVLSYKRLSQVERAFRSLKTIDLKIRPIRHRLEDRVRAHIFLCMLAYYVQWHLFEAWRELLLADEDQQAKLSRDPVAPATRSKKALRKVATHTLDDGTQAHSFRTLLQDLSTIVRNHCRRKGAPESESLFPMTTIASPTQRRALDLLKRIAV